MYIDVGGGSTELTLFTNGRPVASGSFNVGTVRLFEDVVPEDCWMAMRHWILDATRSKRPLHGIGSGGNINKLFRMARIKDERPIKRKRVKKTFEDLSLLSYEGRIRQFALKSDRADVVIPACKIYLAVTKWAGIKKIYVPKIGLADGIVHELYDNHISGTDADTA